MSKLKWIVGTSIGLTLLAGTSASATTLTQLSAEDMLAQASDCVVANVVSSTTEKRNGQVFTLTTFNVTKTAFGSAGQTIKVETLGGRSNVGRLKTSCVVAGSPRFFIGQESVMLLSHDTETDNYSIVGFNQGSFPVRRTLDGNSTVSLPLALGGPVDLNQGLESLAAQRGIPAGNLLGD